VLTLQGGADEVGTARQLAAVVDEEVSEALAEAWGSAASATWNRIRAAVLSWLTWCRSKKHCPRPGFRTTRSGGR
jgi:integrase/recombinase XerC